MKNILNTMFLVLAVLIVTQKAQCYSWKLFNNTDEKLRLKVYGDAWLGTPNMLGADQFVTVDPMQDVKVTGTGGQAGLCLGAIKVARQGEGFRDAVIQVLDEGNKKEVLTLIDKLADALASFNLKFTGEDIKKLEVKAAQKATEEATQEATEEVATDAAGNNNTLTTEETAQLVGTLKDIDAEESALSKAGSTVLGTVTKAASKLSGNQVYQIVQESVKLAGKIASASARLQTVSGCASRTYEIVLIPVQRKIGTYIKLDVVPYAIYVP